MICLIIAYWEYNMHTLVRVPGYILSNGGVSFHWHTILHNCLDFTCSRLQTGKGREPPCKTSC